jgi:uncharacterized membrane protein YccC
MWTPIADRDVGGELRLAAKMTLAGTIAWWVCIQLGATNPIFAVLVPLVAMTGDPFSAVSVSIDRILGIFAGVGIGIVLVHTDLASTVDVAIALAVGTAGGIVLRVGQRVNVQAAISALFMIAVAGSSQAGIARIWETAIGSVVSIVVAALLWPPDPLRELLRRLERLRLELAADFAAVADDLATGSGAIAAQMDMVRAHSLEAIRDVFELEPARRALRLSPLRRADIGEVLRTEREITLAARLFRHARAVARDVADLQVVSTSLASATRDLADAADRTLLGRDPGEPLARAAIDLEKPVEGGALVVAAQLTQLLDDLRSATQLADVEGDREPLSVEPELEAGVPE